MKTLTKIALVTLTLATALATQAQNYIYGTSRTFGNTTYQNYNDSTGSSLSGTSRSFGNTTYHNYSDTDGRTITGTTRTFGNTSYTSLDEY